MAWLDRLYVGGCRVAGKFRRPKQEQRANDELRENLELAGLTVRAEEVETFALLAAACSALPVVVGAFIGLQLAILVFFFPLPPLAYTLVGWYPKLRAEGKRTRSLGGVPAFVSYMSMSMRINPNLERATFFTAENLENELGRSLRQALGRFHLRVHASVGEALSWFANRWRRSGELNRSICLLQNSASERTEDARFRTLDRALELSLQGMRDRMREFAVWIRLPTLLIYSMGVLLPLVLVAILPVLATVSLNVGLSEIFAIYCIALPIAVYSLSRWTLAKRPSASPLPEVPIEASGARALMLAGIPAASLIVAGLAAPVVDDARFLLILWGAVLGASLYLHLTTARAFKHRGLVERMENEFEDALAQLGNLISEGRPAEDAFERVADATRGGELSRVFAKVSANVRLGGMGLRASLFNPEGGALRGVHSKTIRNVLGLLVDLIERSTRVAGMAILRTADHLRKLKRVELEVRRSLSEVVSSMRSVALFFAPLIASVISRIQGVIASRGGVGFISFGSVQPAAFLFVLGLYTVLLAAILSLYATEIEFGDDSLARRVAMARALPIALAVFTLGALASGQLVRAIVG